MMLRAYGAQESDCISPPFGDIRLEGNQTLQLTQLIRRPEGQKLGKTSGGSSARKILHGFRPSGLHLGIGLRGRELVTRGGNVREARDMHSVI
jgi:hypothetical protein